MKNTKQAKSAVPGLNVELLRKVKRHILEEPRRFLMRAYRCVKWDRYPTYIGDDGKGHAYAKCGTVACIAGWATILHEKDQPTFVNEYTGRKALNIDRFHSSKLFFDDAWPDKYRSQYYGIKTMKGRARVAANRIEHFIKTGE